MTTSIWPFVLLGFGAACSDLDQTHEDSTTSRSSTDPSGSYLEAVLAEATESTPPPESALITDAAPGRGLGRMTARVPGTNEVVGGVRLETHHVRVTTIDGLVHTEIEESFFNESSRVLEGRLVLPIPSDAVLSRLALYVDGKLVEGEVVARRRADRIFRGIVDDTVRPRDPALLDALGGGALSLRIFPIPARKARKVVFAYDQILRRDATGRFNVRVPLSFGDAPTLVDRVTVEIDGIRLLDERSPEVLDDVAITLDEEPPDVLVALGTTHDVALVRAVAEGAGDESTFEGDVAIVLDVSSAQTEASLLLQKSFAKAVIDDLGAEENFVVLACDAACETFPKDGRALSSTDIVAEAGAFLDGLSPRGAYDLGGALLAADARITEVSSESAAQILLLSNGASSSGQLSTDDVVTRTQKALVDRDVRIIGVGRAVDSPNLTALAVALGATYDPLVPGAPATHLARLRRAPISKGPVVDLPAGFAAVETSTALPTRLGEEVVFLARGRAAASEEFARTTVAPLARFWASERIATLESASDRDVGEIVSLATEHHILSSETSLLVLENDAMFAQYAVPQTPRVEDWTSSATSSPRAPQVRMCTCTVSGRLPPEAVQRVVRQNFGRMRACYQTALARSPTLSGRITTRFVIGRSGAVRSVKNASSEITDDKLIDCVTKAFAPLSFPQPEGGTVTVDYPISFANSEGSSGGGDTEPVAMKIPRGFKSSFNLGDPWPTNSGSRPKPPPPPPEQQPTVSHRPGEDAWLEPGLHERAISRLEARLATHEESRPARRNLVRDTLLRGQIERARAHAATWVEVDPDNAQAHEVYAETLVASGRARDAAMELSTAAALDPRAEERQFAAAFTWQKIGDHERACSHLVALAELDADFTEDAGSCREGNAPNGLVRTRGFDIATAPDTDGHQPPAVVISPDGRVISELLVGHKGLVSGTYRTVVVGERQGLGGAVTVRALGVEFTVELGEQERTTSIISEVWIPRFRRPVVRGSGRSI